MKRFILGVFWAFWLLAGSALAQTVTVSVPDVQKPEGKTFRLPVQASNLTGLNIYSLDFTLVYDASVLTAMDVRTSGSLTASWGTPTYNISNGQVQVGLGGTSALAGAGDLIYIDFKVNDGVANGKTSTLTFTQFKFNEGQPSVQLNNGKFTVIPDTEPPKITSGPQVANITSHSADIRWQTDEPSDSKVEYGTSTSYGQSVKNTQLVTSHTLHLHGLQPSTRYYYRISSTDKLGNGPIVSEMKTFSTADIVIQLPSLSFDPGEEIEFPLTISDVTEQGITSLNFVLTYDANLLSATGVSTSGTIISAWDSPSFQTAPGKVTIGLSGNAPLSGQGVLVKIQFHIADDAKIGQSTPVVFQTFSLKNSAGGTIIAKTKNGLFTVEDTHPPKIVSGPRATSITSKSAIITWQTNEKSTSIVWFGKDASYVWRKRNQIRTIDHQILLTNLSPSTTYHFQVGSVDSSGNGPSKSADDTFSTLPGTGIMLSVQDAVGQAGDRIIVPLEISDVSNQGVEKYSLVLTYDSDLITAVSATSEGTLTGGWGAPSFQKVDGQIVVQAESETPLVGQGTLVKLVFLVKSDVTDGLTTPISLIFAQLNTGSPEVATSNGVLTLHGTPDTQAPQIIFGPFAQNISATGAQIIWMTDEPASEIVAYGQTSSLGKSTGQSGVSGVLHRVTLSGLEPGKTYYFQIHSSDRWDNGPTNSGVNAFKTTSGGEVLVALPSETVQAGAEFDWPVQIGDVSGKKVGSADLTILYDPTVLTAISASTAGTQASGWGPPTFTLSEGKIIIAMAGINYLSGSGTLLKIHFKVATNAMSGTKTPVVFKRFVFNEGTPASIYQSGVLTVKDVSPPKIVAGPSAIGKTATMATILWATDEPSTGKVEYGETANYGQMEESNILEKSHLSVLTNLRSGTVYHFRVYSSDESGNGPTMSSDETFKTVVEQPMILRVPSVEYDEGQTFDLPIQLDSIRNNRLYSFQLTLKFDSNFLNAVDVLTANSLTESWELPSISIGEDSIQIAMQSTTPIQENGVLFRVRFRVQENGAYNQSSQLSLNHVLANGRRSDILVRNGSFTLKDLTPPIITSGPGTAEIGAHSVHIVWSTNEPANSKVEYGLSENYDKIAEDPNLVTFHDVFIDGLSHNALYHFRVSSTDSLGNGPTKSNDQTFQTTAGNEIKISIPDTLAPIGETLWYPIFVEDLTGKNISSYRFSLKFDSTAMTALAVKKTNTLCENWNDPSVVITDTSIIVSQSGNNPLVGKGALIVIQFQVKNNALPGKGVGLFFDFFQFNNGNPPASPGSARWLLVDRTPPKFIEGPFIQEIGFNYAKIAWKTNELSVGEVDYGTTQSYGTRLFETKIDRIHEKTLDNLAPSTIYHVQVSISDTAGNGPVRSNDLQFKTLSDTVFITIPDTTVAIGSSFELPLFVTNLTGFNITHFVLEIAYDPNQLSALGASSSGTITQDWGMPAFSASHNVLHVEMSGETPLVGSGLLIRLKFQLLGGVMPESDIKIPFQTFLFNQGKPAVQINQPNIHAIAGGIGVTVALPDTNLFPGQQAALPVWISDVTNKGIFSFEGRIDFSSSVFSVLDFDQNKSLSASWGKMNVHVYRDSVVFLAQGTRALADSGALFYLIGKTNSQTAEGDTTGLIFNRFRFNHGNPVAAVRDGRIRIIIRHDVISGFVFEEDSVTAIAHAAVTAKETGGQKSKTVQTDTTGFFQITGLDSTKTYDVTVSKSGYTTTASQKNIKPGTQNLRFYLEKQNGFIDGWVKSNDGEAVTGALVIADDGHHHFGSASSDSTGYFAINHLAKRYAYTLKITKYGFYDQTLPGITVNQTVSIILHWSYGKIFGIVTDTTKAPMDSVYVQALNLKTGIKAGSFLTGKDGEYHLDSLKANQYLLYALRDGFVSTPNQAAIDLAPGDSILANFTMEKAILATIEISGDVEIPNNIPSRFDFVAKTAAGKVMSLRAPVWNFWPEAAGVVSEGVVYPDSQYFGRAYLSVTDPFTGISDTLSLSLYASINANSQINIANAEGLMLSIEPGSVDQSQKIKVQSVKLPPVKKSTRMFSGLGRGFVLKPSGYHFKKPLVLKMPVPAGFPVNRVTIGRWNEEKAHWDPLKTNVFDAKTVSAEIESFSLFAVLNPSRDLGLLALQFRPNPFSPNVDSDGNGNPGLTIELVVTSRDTRRPFVSIEIYNMLGQKVRTLVDHAPKNKDQYLQFHWDGLTDDGRMARNGRYIVKVDVSDATGTKSKVKTVVLVK